MVLKEDSKPIKVESKIQQLDLTAIRKKKEPLAQSAAEMKVCNVFYPFNDQMLHMGGGSESSAVYPGEVKKFCNQKFLHRCSQSMRYMQTKS